MEISYRRTGGFAGMVTVFSIRTETLPVEEGRALQDLVMESGFFALPEKITSEGLAADRFQYTISVDTGKQQHTVEVGETAVPENLWPLLNQLNAISRSGRSKEG